MWLNPSHHLKKKDTLPQTALHHCTMQKQQPVVHSCWGRCYFLFCCWKNSVSWLLDIRKKMTYRSSKSRATSPSTRAVVIPEHETGQFSIAHSCANLRLSESVSHQGPVEIQQLNVKSCLNLLRALSVLRKCFTYSQKCRDVLTCLHP